MTTTSSPSILIAVAEPVFGNAERLALAGFPGRVHRPDSGGLHAGLRQYASWCRQHHVCLFNARRADIECFARNWNPRAGLGPQ